MAKESNEKTIVLKCDDAGDKDAVEAFLFQVYNMDDKRVEALFKMMPHEVQRLKDTLRRSNV